MKERTPIQVKAYAGYRGEESPRSFLWQEKPCAVAKILSASSEHELDGGWIRRFQVETDAGLRCTLIYDEEERAWFMEG